MVGKHVKCDNLRKNGTLSLRGSESKKIFNKTWNQETKPVEVYRKDFITAMTIPSHQTLKGDFIKIADSWREEYDKGVQVPVDIDSLPHPSFTTLTRDYELVPWSLPDKYIKWEPCSSVMDIVSGGGVPSPLYDMDDADLAFFTSLSEVEDGRPLTETQFEQVITYLDTLAHVNMLEKYRENLSYSIQYDDSVSCEVCKDVYSEPDNEMIFCDSCNICVHQGCYGIARVPAGEWLCAPCKARSPVPVCLLCLQGEGAFKATAQGEWIHVFCALWIPEVGFGSVERMEPITRINQIPASRWALACTFCQEKVGAAIQCSGEDCFTSFHPSCAYDNHCHMKTVFGAGEADPVENFAYCLKHSAGKENVAAAANTIVLPLNHKRELNPLYNNQAKIMRNLQKHFHEYADILDTSAAVDVNVSLVQLIFDYWREKRRANGNNPLISELPPLNELVERSAKPNTNTTNPELDPFFKLVSLRQDLERARALLYMAERRERLKKRLLRSTRALVEHCIQTDQPLPGSLTKRRNSEPGGCYNSDDSLNISHSKILSSPLVPSTVLPSSDGMLVEGEVVLSGEERQGQLDRMKELARVFSKKIVIAFSDKSDAGQSEETAGGGGGGGHFTTPPTSPEYGGRTTESKRKRTESGGRFLTPPSPGAKPPKPLTSSSPRRPSSKRHKPNPKYKNQYFT